MNTFSGVAVNMETGRLHQKLRWLCWIASCAIALAISCPRILAVESEVVVEEFPGSFAVDVTADSLGNVFACGSERAPDRNYPIVRKFRVGGQWETQRLPDGTSVTAIASADVTVQGQQQSHVVAAGSYGVGEAAGWVVSRSRNQGTWETLAVFTNLNSYYAPKAVTVDKDGSIYVIGTAKVQLVSRKSTTIVYRWLVVRGIIGLDGKLEWQTFNPPFDGQIMGVVCNQGFVFVVGYNSGYWQVGRSGDKGASWQLVDQYRYDARYSSGAFAVTLDGSGNLIVVGRAETVVKGKAKHYGVVRKGTNDGTAWETLKVFDFGGFGEVWAAGVTVDLFGTIHVVGSAPFPGSTVRQWFTLKGSDSPLSSWTLTDQFRFAPDYWATGQRIAADIYGNVFAIGQARHPDESDHSWMVRWIPVATP